ncbi:MULTISPECIES: zinc-dependent alcohol dehydrogenase family protein [unclassified Pseudomonas]|uniref:zinc-dependent alcohol dehydrogenase family protein n=1 Tax=unclassified Pseudomonas TaxID=196821 RepID=UPI002AC8CA79|nr:MULTISPECIES: zinc-dependent alcohol dehydrogenase family protein [unclassified Pseudomonas]MEB0039232.1 zinc-dependent alcohol dehydrogenase family protein [Pseudomonas sp. MH10]MEB0076133.1 zinc-dependent alcohol dehydrogenase family protein [Pseudomonas sp. MH10out]MEB0092909.1 zinc-dependent alcohol dehydrogenase family protein [Pseudomonas sp. CCI4.2]MEB0100067.1 zinc-dependent alcohol dehydrogenase family protein [Pseudomonas sp. CCI3.2]MEB0119672.1 zinc-dependent alcohol dehydrogenas
MSRTIRFHQFGPAEVLKIEEFPAAQPAPGEVQVRVEAIGISWYDVLWRQNLAPSQARLPAGLGQEMAGVVSALGEGVTDLAVGDKVASFPAATANQHPVYGELIVLPRAALTRYPDLLTPVEASVHYTPLLIAYFAYVDLARVKPGQTALITDATHCAGPAFVQMGKALGVKVIAAAKSAEQRDNLLALGADKVVVTEEQDLLIAINKYTDNRGVDVVLDGLGGPQMSILGDVLAPRGSLILYGLQGGNQTPFPACAAFQKNIQFFVHCLGNFTGKPELGITQDEAALQRALREINQLTADRVLLPQVTRIFAFDDVVAAHRYMDQCPVTGRAVLVVDPA